MPKKIEKHPQQKTNSIPQCGFLRMNQIIRIPGSELPGLIPVSRSTWLNGVKSGLYPQPIQLGGSRSKAWRVEDIRKLIESLNGSAWTSVPAIKPKARKKDTAEAETFLGVQK